MIGHIFIYNKPLYLLVLTISLSLFYLYRVKRNDIKNKNITKRAFIDHALFLSSWIDIWKKELSQYSHRNCDEYYLLRLKTALVCLEASLDNASKDWLWMDSRVVLQKNQNKFLEKLDDFIKSLEKTFDDTTQIKALRDNYLNLLEEQESKIITLSSIKKSI